MAQEYFTASWFGVRYFMFNYTKDTVPSASTTTAEIKDVLSCGLGEITKENTKYRTLDGNGWESIATLGNTQGDATFECIRSGTGAYEAAGTDTYSKIKSWFLAATGDSGVASPKSIIEVVPRPSSNGTVYDGTMYNVVPNSWNPGTRDTSTGQEYSFTVSPFGPPVPLAVTFDASAGTFSFSKLTASNGDGE